ncbi:hypothetical protein ACIRUG_28795 [Pseudomonas aeruginosa]
MRIEKRARWFALVRQVCAVLLVLCSWSAYAEPYYWAAAKTECNT